MDEEPFDGSSPEITEMTVRNKRLLHQLRETDYADNEAKQRIYRQMFGSIGKDVYIDIDFRCEYGKNIYFGNKVIVNMNCTFLDNNNIIIGNNVMIAPDVKIYTATHSVHLAERMPETDMSRSVHLRHNCPPRPYRRWCMDREAALQLVPGVTSR